MSDPAIPGLSLQALYADHHRWLLGWLRRKLAGHHRAEDLAQDTFLRILSAQQRRGMPEADLREPRAFLVTTATRLLIDDARRRELERSYLQALAAAHGNESLPSPEHLAEIVETLSAIARLLDGLPGKPRAAFLMYRFEGLPQAEIGRRLGVSASMIKQYVAQAMVHCYAARHGLDTR